MQEQECPHHWESFPVPLASMCHRVEILACFLIFMSSVTVTVHDEFSIRLRTSWSIPLQWLHLWPDPSLRLAQLRLPESLRFAVTSNDQPRASGEISAKNFADTTRRLILALSVLFLRLIYLCWRHLRTCYHPCPYPPQFPGLEWYELVLK